MEFRILGPLEVRDGDSVIEVMAPKQRLILTVLALAMMSLALVTFA